MTKVDAGRAEIKQYSESTERFLKDQNTEILRTHKETDGMKRRLAKVDLVLRSEVGRRLEFCEQNRVELSSQVLGTLQHMTEQINKERHQFEVKAIEELTHMKIALAEERKTRIDSDKLLLEEVKNFLGELTSE